MKKALALTALLWGCSVMAQPISAPIYCKFFGRFHVLRCPAGLWLFKGGLNGYVPGSGAALQFTNLRTNTTVAVTTTRSSNETCQDKNSNFVVLTSNKPCVTQYGLRPEPAITNLVIWSQDSSHWTLSGTTAVNNTAGSPANDATVNTVTASAGLAEHKATYAPTVVTTASYTFSVYAKSGTVNFISLWDSLNTATHYCEFNVSTQTVQATGGTAYQCQVLTYGLPNGWARYVASIKSFSAVNPTMNISIGDTAGNGVAGTSWTAAGTETVNLWGVQLETTAPCAVTNLFCPASGYVPTTGTTAARSSDDNKIAWPSTFGFTDFSVRTDATLDAPNAYYLGATTDFTWASVIGSNGAKGAMAMFWQGTTPVNPGLSGRFDDNTLIAGITINTGVSSLVAGDISSGRWSYAKNGNVCSEFLYKNGASDGIGPNTAGFTSNGMDNEIEFHVGWDGRSLRGAVGGIALHDVCLDNTLNGCLK